MGSSASKPETKVFTPSTPIDFSASFLSQLENSSEVSISLTSTIQEMNKNILTYDLVGLLSCSIHRKVHSR